MKLYDLELSGNCYKVRLFAALAGIAIEIRPVDFLGGEHKAAAFLAMNPLGEIPVLVDGEVVLRDSQAILVYLASRYGPSSWYPREPAAQARILQWLSSAANQVQHGPADARPIEKFGYPLDKGAALRIAGQILGFLEQHLGSHDWLELGRPTIADCAVFPYVALAPEGGIALGPYPAVRGWIARVKALPGFRPMPGLA